MKNILPLIIFVGLALSVYDCGYKGPLYLPKKTPVSNPVTSKPVSSSAWTITSTKESATIESSTTNKNSNLIKNN